MSSPSNDGQLSVKQTRLSGSCDFCRKRKIKCNSATMPNNECTTCLTSNKVCTHDTPLKKRGIKNYARQVQQLEQKVRELEATLQARNSSPPITASPDTAGSSVPDNEDPDLDEEYIEMLDNFKRFSLNQNARYFGPSSNIYFMCKMMDSAPSMNGAVSRSGNGKKWTMHPWETDAIKRPHFIFPESDLLHHLMDVYFTCRASCIPVLHQPSFRKDVAAGLHFTDASFGSVVLLMCAVASRYTDDPRVLLDGASTHSAGWKYFQQTTSMPRALFSCPTLHDVQFCTLYCEYMMGTSAPQSNWSILGLGIRYSLELGYHRRYHGPPTLQNELQKRIFWSLVFLDRHISLYFGRPFAIRDEDFDLDFPLDCDDDYIGTGDPSTDFIQPPGQPTRISAFLHHLRLINIMSAAAKTIYGTKKSRQASGCFGNSDDTTLALIDSMLNSWFNAIPDHLRWDHVQTTPWSYESGLLYLTYYDLQILVHRPYVYKKSEQALPSLAICTNAARSLSRLMETMRQRHDRPFFVLDMAAFSAGMILIMNIRNRRNLNPQHEPSGQNLEDLYRCMRVLGHSEKKYSISGRLIQSLLDLADLSSSDTYQAPQPTTSDFTLMPGYMMQQNPPESTNRLDISLLDPTLFGLLPPTDKVWPSYAQADVSLFGTESDFTNWLDAAVTMPSWIQEPIGVLLNDTQLGESGAGYSDTMLTSW